MKFLVLIPAYNEEKKIAKVLLNIFENVTGDFDVLVVNDGSTDGTLKEIPKNKKIKVLNLPFNMGYGIALQTGYKYAIDKEYDYVAQIDADGQHDSSFINPMLKRSSIDNVDVLIGSRFLSKKSYKVPFIRRQGMFLFASIASVLLGKKITDSTSGYQVISKNVLPFLVSASFPYDYPDADLLIMLHYSGYKIEEFPVKMYSNRKKSMHSGLSKNIYYIFKMILSIFTVLIRKITKLPKV